MPTYHGKFGTPQRVRNAGIEKEAGFYWWWADDIHDPPSIEAPPARKRPGGTAVYADPESIPDDPQEEPADGHQVKWTGEHALTESLLRLVERIDYATADEDAAQDMLCSLLQRMHRAKTQADFRTSVHFALLDARRKRAQMTPAGVSWEDMPEGGFQDGKDRRKDQLPGPIKPYEGTEPPVRERIPQSRIAQRVILTEETCGEYRFDKTCQVAAYVMQ
jgi:hypothetical protein